MIGAGSINAGMAARPWNSGEVIMEEITADAIVEVTPQLRSFMKHRVINGVLESVYDGALALYRPEKPVAFDFYSIDAAGSAVSLIDELGRVLEPYVDFLYDQDESTILFLREQNFPLTLCYHEGVTFHASKDLGWYSTVSATVVQSTGTNLPVNHHQLTTYNGAATIPNSGVFDWSP
jgi:hypothetical protein